MHGHIRDRHYIIAYSRTIGMNRVSDIMMKKNWWILVLYGDLSLYREYNKYLAHVCLQLLRHVIIKVTESIKQIQMRTCQNNTTIM